MNHVSSLSDVDLELIEKQLGRTPRGIVEVSSRSTSGVPLVLKMRSWVGSAPFPTLFWLSSKDLHKAINTIETSGYVKALELRIQNDENFKQELLGDQQRYKALRDKNLLEEDRLALAQAGLLDTFAGFGIGGIKQWDKVRCLHMHYAYHLVEGCMVGRILDEEFALNKLVIRA